MSQSTKGNTSGKGKGDPALRAGAKSHVMESIKARERTDETIKGWITYLPPIGVGGGVLVGFVFAYWLGTLEGLVVGLFFMFTVAFAFTALLNYRLLLRLREHFRRESMLRRGLLEYLRTVVEEKGTLERIGTELSNLESIEREAGSEEKAPDPMYAALGALPIVGIFISLLSLHALTSLPPAHEKRWMAFLQQASVAAKPNGLELRFATNATLKKREFALYAVLAIVFLPFLVYWYRLLVGEMNSHFSSQWRDEDYLLRELGR